jgi:hypothetical protein
VSDMPFCFGCRRPFPHVSARGLPLIVTDSAERMLTAELYCKWYELYIVTTSEPVIVPFGDLEAHAPEGESAYIDHVPNPRAIEAYAEAEGVHIDSLFLEVAHGRWLLEVAQGALCAHRATGLIQATTTRHRDK